MTTTTPKTYVEMVTTTDLPSWFTVIDRHTLHRVEHNGRHIAFATKREAITHAKILGWDRYTWSPDGR